MKDLTKLTGVALLLLALSTYAQQEILPKAFYKGCLVTSITNGPSSAIYSTHTSDGAPVHTEKIRGYIDPLIMEYGLTDRIGIGFTKGGESFNVNVNDFYNTKVPDDSKFMAANTKYFTLDYSYHPFYTKRIDISMFGSIGYYKVSGTCYKGNGDNVAGSSCGPELYNYKAKGAVVRGGIRTRIYFSKRFGVMGMLYAFNGYAKERSKPNVISDAPNTSGYSTMLLGAGAEFGICFRIFKQKGVKEEIKKSWQDRWNDRLSSRSAAKSKSENEEESDKKPLFRLVWD